MDTARGSTSAPSSHVIVSARGVAGDGVARDVLGESTPGVVALFGAVAILALPAVPAGQASLAVTDDLDGDSLPDPGGIDSLPDIDYLARGLVSGGECLRLGQLAVLVEVGAADSLATYLDEGVSGAWSDAFDPPNLDRVDAVVQRGEHLGHGASKEQSMN